jgi:hypothetical protein
MELQYCENGINPRCIIGVNSLLIKNRIVKVVHSNEIVSSKVKVEDATIIYLEADDELIVMVCTSEGEVTVAEMKTLTIQFSGDQVILDSGPLSDLYSIHITD